MKLGCQGRSRERSLGSALCVRPVLRRGATFIREPRNSGNAQRGRPGSRTKSLTHTHADAHFVLISGGDYVSIAEGRPAERLPLLVYNPPGTTHRDHFEYGRGSYFAISLEPAKAKSAGAELALPDGPIFLSEMEQFAIAMRIARCCARAAWRPDAGGPVSRVAREHGSGVRNASTEDRRVGWGRPLISFMTNAWKISHCRCCRRRRHPSGSFGAQLSPSLSL